MKKVEQNNFINYALSGQFQNAGYVHIFASDRTWTNPVIDVNVKHKWIREHTALFDDLQNAIYSGATIFNNRKLNDDDQILHLDLKSAYPAYMVSEYKKPGNRREEWYFYVGHHPDKINLYEIEFRVKNDNDFIKWFINEVAYTKRNVVREEEFTTGKCRFFSSPELPMSDYVAKMLEHENYRVVKTIQFSTEDSFIDNFVNKKNIIDLYNKKETKYDQFDMVTTNDYKRMLNESSGWLNRIDRPTYYHMIQTIKFNIIRLTYDNDLFDDLISVMTDGCYFRITENNQHKINKLMSNIDDHRVKHQMRDTKGKLYDLGTWSYEFLKGSDLTQKYLQTVRKKKE